MLASVLVLLLAGAIAARPLGPLTYQEYKRQVLIPGDDSQLIFLQTQITPASGKGQSFPVTGTSVLGVEQFLGIPFGEAPIGDLRFEHPRPKVYSGHVSGFRPPPACMQRTSLLNGLFGNSEDCLHLNVIAPEGTIGQGKSLPVMVWIFGGGFTVGTGNTYLTPSIDRPFILVTVNYRVDIWGWGYGKQIASAQAGNNGLRDQILALEWVRENIAAFGGDPARVTVFGQSAGAISIACLMLNETQDLFQGAILMSGAASTAPIGPTESTWQSSFDLVAGYAGCQDAEDKLACLKGVPAETLVAASEQMGETYPTAFPFAPSIDGDLIPYSPWQMLKDGRFARIPFIIGNTRDEGTGFLGGDVGTTGASIEQLFDSLYPAPIDPAIKSRVLERYPEDPALGAPFGTGDEVWNTSALFKQASAVITDAAFQSRRRWFIRQANEHGFNRTWSYEFEGETPALSPHLGITHGTDVPFVFGLATPLLRYTPDNVEISRAMMNSFINFAYYLDPNGVPAPPEAEDHPDDDGTITARQDGGERAPFNETYWYPHNYPADKNSLRMSPSAFGMIQDDFREDRMSVFNEAEVAQHMWMRRGM